MSKSALPSRLLGGAVFVSLLAFNVGDVQHHLALIFGLMALTLLIDRLMGR